MIAVVISRRVLARCRSDGNKLSSVKSFIILLSGEGLTSLNKNNCDNFSGEKRENETFRSVVVENTRNKNSNFILQSIGSLRCHNGDDNENIKKAIG